ncbi:diacylglycerol/lipid kinase family protein [Aliikangiella coralliicola]|uniref:Diacylglycerol kinase family lipid kinase n=1 Tax=Aliikangiella coralliicola TaxID=2592383 RepID=A0A545UF66_9GAMM|nr:diacylglycerol kinase family protein [Aliikangiella coralliicola]TQV88121.1 diacylglycerol kinase family lipid kinase [Aliikangiella coralliicola]
MKLLVIYNPQAGNGRAKILLPQVRQYLNEKGLDAELLLTDRPAHAVELVAESDLSRYDGLIASGGDGTLFEVVNGYYQCNSEKKPPIGLIPNGTGNAFMKELQLQKSDWRKAIDIIASNHSRPLDVGRFVSQNQTHHFLNIVGMGFVTDVAQAAIPLKWMGNAAYTVATLQKLINLKAQKMVLEIDGKTIERDGVFVEVANSRYTGTTFLMAPKAELDDGLLDVVLLNNVSRLKLLRLFTSIYDGSHIKYPEIEYLQVKKVKVIEENPGMLIPDGEVMGRTPVEFECLHKDIEFFWAK